ncbi:MAG: hypothetical protein AAGE94_07175 [Acidobacteriota bacterium]
MTSIHQTPTRSIPIRRTLAPRTRRRHRLVLAAAVVLAFPFVAEPVSACSTRLADPAGEVALGDPTLRVAGVDGDDLLVVVGWDDPAEAMALVLETTAEPPVEVDSWSVVPPAHADEPIDLVGAFDAVATYGFTYRLRLVDALGVTRAATDLALEVDCPGDVCRYRLLPGVGGADLPRMPLALWQAITEARSLGIPDVFTWVEATYPELARHVPGFVWQWQRRHGIGSDGTGSDATSDAVTRKMAEPSDPPPATGCQCWWVEIVSTTPNLPNGGVSFGGPTGGPPTHVAGGRNSGAGHLALAQTIDAVELTTADLGGTTVFGIEPFCARATGAETSSFATEWPSLPELMLGSPNFEPCDTPCVPDIHYWAETELCAMGFASADAGTQTSADARAAGSLLFDGVFVSVAAVDASATPAPFDEIYEKALDGESKSGSRSTESGLATVTASGFVDLDADNSVDSTGAYVAGGSTFGWAVEIWVPNSCPGLPELPAPGARAQSIRLRGPGQGGAVLRSWENIP